MTSAGEGPRHRSGRSGLEEMGGSDRDMLIEVVAHTTVPHAAHHTTHSPFAHLVHPLFHKELPRETFNAEIPQRDSPRNCVCCATKLTAPYPPISCLQKNGKEK